MPLTAKEIERRLNTIEGLNLVELVPVSEVATPFFYLRGMVFLYGEAFTFSTEIKITEFQRDEDIARLGASLLAAVEGAKRKVSR